MTREEMVTKLIGYAKTAFKKEIDGVVGDTDIAEKFGTNSMQRIAMCALIENEFDVIVPVKSFGSYATFNELADFVLSEME